MDRTSGGRPAPTRLARGPTPAERIKIRVERAALLLRGAPVAILGGALVAVAVWLAGRGWADPRELTVWAAATLALSLVRLALWLRFVGLPRDARGLAWFTRFHVVAMAVSGLLWGALAVVFARAGHADAPFLAFVLAGMSAATVSTASASWKSVVAFSAPALGAFAGANLLTEAPQGVALATLATVYAFAMGFLSFYSERMIVRGIRLRGRNEAAVTAMTRRLDAAEEAERRFRALIEVSPDLTLILSTEGRILYASPSANRLLDTPASLLVGRFVRDVVRPEDMPLFRAVGGKALAAVGEAVSLRHVRLRRADGDYAPFAGRLVNMMYVPGVDGFVLSAVPLRRRVDPGDADKGEAVADAAAAARATPLRESGR